MSLVIGAPVRCIHQEGDRRQGLLGIDQRVHHQKRMEVNEPARVEAQKLRSQLLHQWAPSVMLNRVPGVGYSAQDARAIALKTTGCGPTIPHSAENRRMHPRSHQRA